LAVGFWLLAIGCWLLAIGFWQLAVWLLGILSSRFITVFVYGFGFSIKQQG